MRGDGASVRLDPRLMQVARAKVKDMLENPPSSSCGLHSWSANGPWTPCCYNRGGGGQCVWEKGREIAGYPVRTYEIAQEGEPLSSYSLREVMQGWAESRGHRETMLNEGQFGGRSWKSCGVAINDRYAVMWFGDE